ncbi:hypothetical protein [Pseudoneobacillus sp. C159]
MKDVEKDISNGLNQIFEIINAKGDVEEIESINKDYEKKKINNKNPSD